MYTGMLHSQAEWAFMLYNSLQPDASAYRFVFTSLRL